MSDASLAAVILIVKDFIIFKQRVKVLVRSRRRNVHRHALPRINWLRNYYKEKFVYGFLSGRCFAKEKFLTEDGDKNTYKNIKFLYVHFLFSNVCFYCRQQIYVKTINQRLLNRNYVDIKSVYAKSRRQERKRNKAHANFISSYLKCDSEYYNKNGFKYLI